MIPPEETGPTRVLVVDDDTLLRHYLEQALTARGYAVVTAESAEEAREAVAIEAPDCALVDLSLPGASGTDLCRCIRADPALGAIPLLVITGFEDLESRLAAFAAGADDCLVKPINTDELAARLRAHLELARLRSEVASLRGVFATLRLVSHEFNNPLQIALGALDLLRESTQAPLDPAHAEVLTMLTEATEELAALSARVVSITQPAFKPSPIGTMLDVDASR